MLSGKSYSPMPGPQYKPSSDGRPQQPLSPGSKSRAIAVARSINQLQTPTAGVPPQAPKTGPKAEPPDPLEQELQRVSSQPRQTPSPIY